MVPEIHTQEAPQSASAPAAEPTASRWVFACIGLCLALAILYAGELLSTAYYYAVLQRGFEKSLSGDVDLAFALDNPEFQRLFAGSQHEIRTLRPVVSLIMLRDAGKAASYLKKLSLPETPQNTQLIRNLNELSALHDKGENSKLESEKLRAAQDALKESYLDVKAAEYAFLNGEKNPRPFRADLKQAPDELLFYTSGILDGLPLIDGLPDAVQDFAQLVHFYPLTKPHVPPPTSEALMEEIQQLRLQSLNIKADFESNAEGLTAAEESGEQSAARQEELFKDSRIIVKRIFIDVGKPKLDPNAALLYDKARKFLARLDGTGWDISLPPLKTAF
jgi:hypothetical protein